MAFTAFDELGNSPVFNFTPFNSTARRMGRIPGNQLTNLLNELFPLGLQPKVLSDDYNWMFAQALHVEPEAGDDSKIASPIYTNLDLDEINTYSNLKVTIEYGTGDAGNDSEGQGDDPVELLEHRWSTGGEYITLPSGGFEWGDGGAVGEETPTGLLLCHFEQQIRWPRVENPPFSVIRDRISSVNNEDVVFKTGTCAPETLLFLGAELHRTVLTSGELAWDVTYRFSERRVPLATSDTLGGEMGADAITVGGWNHFFRSEYETDLQAGEPAALDGKTGFYRLKVKGDGRVGADDPIYQLKSFAELFQQAS